MKRLFIVALLAIVTVSTYARKTFVNTTVVADTIYYAQNMKNVANADQASYYRLLMTEGNGLKKQEVFRDFYMNGTVKAEGGYSFIDLGNDKNTVLNGEVTTFYPNGNEKWHGTYVNGKRQGYFTLQMREGGVAVVVYENGQSKFDYFTITKADGTMEKHNISELKALM